MGKGIPVFTSVEAADGFIAKQEIINLSNTAQETLRKTLVRAVTDSLIYLSRVRYPKNAPLIMSLARIS